MWLVGIILLTATTVQSDEGWSWGSGKKSENKAQSAGSNNSTLVDDLLISGRSGRHLDGYDEVYSDPEIQQALNSGNDSNARHYIKERLCGLGLMACEDDIEEKRPHVRPGDLIYAQPVHLKPVGRPITAIPIKGGSSLVGSGGYGPPRPVPLPSDSYGPPLRPPPRPYYGPPRGQPGPIYAGSKPPASVYEPEPEYPFVKPTPIIEDKKPVVVVNTQQSSSSVQQHVHHHFHHNGDKVAVPVPVSSSVSDHDTYSSSETNYPPLSSSYRPSHSLGSGSLYSNSIAGSNYASSYNGLSSYSGLSSSGEGPYYKKDFNINKGSYNSANGLIGSSPSYSGNNYGSNKYATNNNYASNSYATNNFPKYETPRADGGFSDCICVAYEQCPPNEIARKEDGYFIDPRNNKDSSIEALGPDEVVVTDGNGTMSIVSKHSKRENSAEAVSSQEDLEGNAKEDANVEPESKSARRRREASPEAQPLEDTKSHKPRKLSSTNAEDKTDDEYQVVDQSGEQSSRQANFGFSRCPARQVCCRRPIPPPFTQPQYRPSQAATCGQRNTHGINGRIKTPVYVDGDSEFGEYPWQVAILKKDPQESVYVCGGTLIDNLHILTAAHCVKSYSPHDLRVRLGEWDVNHDVEFYPYIERDVQNLFIHPEFYAGTLYNDLAILRIDRTVDFAQNPHISPACLPDAFSDYSGQRCWTTGWGKDAFGDFGKYQNILKEVDVPIVPFQQCQVQLQQTRLGYDFKLHPGFVCAGGEEGKDACKGDGGGPMVCEHRGSWQVVGVVSWGIGCGQYGVPGVYVKVAHYLDWIKQITNRF